MSAVRNLNGKQTVFRVNDYRAHEVQVQLGTQWDQTVQVLSGLKEGDIVVIRPDKGMRDGSRVKVKD